MPPPDGGKVSPIRSEYAVTYRSGRTKLTRRRAKRLLRQCSETCSYPRDAIEALSQASSAAASLNAASILSTPAVKCTEASMWRDPLDELIENLERVVPPQPQVVNEMPSVADFQYFMA